MFKTKGLFLKLFTVTLICAIAIHSTPEKLISSASATETFKVQTSQLIAKKRSSSRSSTRRSTSRKKSGGRSSGGSFKNKRSPGTRSTTKSKPTPRPSTPKTITPRTPTSSPSQRNYDRGYGRDYDRYEPRPSTSSPYLGGTRNRSYRSRRGSSNSFLRLLGFILLFLIIFIPLFLLFKFLTKSLNKESRAARNKEKEITNDIVTVSMVQVALSTQAENLQLDLSELSLNSDTESSEGLLNLMRDSSLILTRNMDGWTYVKASSESVNINDAEAAFEKLSLKERSKYSGESLSNVDGKITTKEIVTQEDDFAYYVVVTLIFGTVDDNPIFERINNQEQLEAALLKLAAMDEEYLLKFELLWCPQAQGTYLNEEELLLQYSDMLPLI